MKFLKKKQYTCLQTFYLTPNYVSISLDHVTQLLTIYGFFFIMLMVTY